MAWHTDSCMADTVRHRTATGDVAGEYVVDEGLPDRRLVIRADTSAKAIRGRAGLEQISGDEFAEHFGQLAIDDEGKPMTPTDVLSNRRLSGGPLAAVRGGREPGRRYVVMPVGVGVLG